MPATCDGTPPSIWQVTASLSAFSTQIVFDDERVDVEQAAATATLGRFASPRLGWSASVGGILAGKIDGRDVQGGATASGTLSWLPLFERPGRPFVALTATASAAFASATADDDERHSWWALDLRGGVTVGKTLAERWVPYVSARTFFGPAFWTRGGERVSGSDRYHVTLGAGLIVRLPSGVDVTAEVMPLGEQSAALGMTLHL